MLPLSILAADLYSVRAIRNSTILQLTLNIINSHVFFFSAAFLPVYLHLYPTDHGLIQDTIEY